MGQKKYLVKVKRSAEQAHEKELAHQLGPRFINRKALEMELIGPETH